MRVTFRVDASVTQGSGHVMRCLTLAERARALGHDVVFISSVDSVGWLADHLTATGFPVISAIADELDMAAVLALEPDWVVVDSYRLDAAAVSALAEAVNVLAIIDGDARGIRAALYLDQNLGADELPWALPSGRMLAGSSYALVRDDVLAVRRAEPAVLGYPPRVAAFMGGTDPTGEIIGVAAALARVEQPFDLTIVAPETHHSEVLAALDGRPATVIAPTAALPAILGSADVIVSAAGTSAWDICTLGIPAVFVSVVDNQSASLAEVVSRGLALGVDLTVGESVHRVTADVSRLLLDGALRRQLAARCAALFDGRGAERVVEALEAGIRLSR